MVGPRLNILRHMNRTRMAYLYFRIQPRECR